MSCIKIKERSGNEIDFDIKDRLTFIGGNSGTGKTFVIDIVKDMKLNGYEVGDSNVDPSRFVIIDSSLNIAVLKEVKDGSIVFIDNYDSFPEDSKKKVIKAMFKYAAIWIICTRYPKFPYGTCYSKDSYKELIAEKSDTGFIFKLENKSW
ncbi:MAG: hypothetical protein IJ593_00900 [Lachnospiraceae bacterium]|nr:hypothetical protein [Lachnospiraceae bacterium]